MKVVFEYSKDKDIWCLLNKGRSSNNNPNPTKVYELLTTKCGESPTEEVTSSFIDMYLSENDVSIEAYTEQYVKEWSLVSDEYHKRAEAVFGVVLPQDVTAYLTINNRNPYSISDNLFYVTVPRDTIRKTVMHELWHFYTWYGLGTDQEEILGKQKYNDMKEALTALLNVECGDLFPDGISDDGYPQHQELRKSILDMWETEKDIKTIWSKLKQMVAKQQL